MDGHSRIQLSASFNLLKNPLRWLPVAGRELCATCDAEGVVAGRELLDERTLRVGQLGRDVHVDMGDEIAALAGLAQLGDAQILQDNRLLGLASGWHGHLLLAVEGVDLHVVTQCAQLIGT